MFKVKIKKSSFVILPQQIADKLKLKNNDEVSLIANKEEIKIKKIHPKSDNKIMKLEGVWKDIKLDVIFSDIRKQWSNWKIFKNSI